jgi:putative FmdB family regulatory protein
MSEMWQLDDSGIGLWIMPKYDFQCIDCNLQLEVEASIHDYPETPDCSICEMPMSRSYGTFGISFKGTGFYSTDKGHK